MKVETSGDEDDATTVADMSESVEDNTEVLIDAGITYEDDTFFEQSKSVHVKSHTGRGTTFNVGGQKSQHSIHIITLAKSEGP